MPFSKIWIHLVWATKRRQPFLTKEIRPLIFRHLKYYGASKNINIELVNGFEDHVHCLVRLRPAQSVSKVVNLLKGESSRWINERFDTELYNWFEWQRGYFAASIGESELKRIKRYIENQEVHHSKQSFEEELDEMGVDFNLL